MSIEDNNLFEHIEMDRGHIMAFIFFKNQFMELNEMQIINKLVIENIIYHVSIIR